MGLNHTLSAAGAAWIPNLAFFLLSITIMTLSRQRADEAALP